MKRAISVVLLFALMITNFLLPVPNINAQSLGIKIPENSIFINPNLINLKISEDATFKIYQKIIKLGGEKNTGSKLADPVECPEASAVYQEYENGVIVYSETWGSCFISKAAFNKWISLKQQTTSDGMNLLTYVGPPIKDSETVLATEYTQFEKAMIVRATSVGNAYLVKGYIYEKYNLYRNELGLPTSEEKPSANGGAYQTFQNGDVYWSSETGAQIVKGLIKNRWLEIGGASGVLGYPISDEEDVMEEEVVDLEFGHPARSIGKVSRFQNGSIYYSSSTGAWELYGDLLTEYERKYEGPTGVLGFPTSGVTNTKSSGGKYSNFQYGVLIYHPTGVYKGVWYLRNLKLHISRFEGDQEDGFLGIAGDADIYVNASMSANNGFTWSKRYPNSGCYGSSKNIDENVEIASYLKGDLEVNISFKGMDDDDGNDDDHLGTVSVKYSADNLWGLLDGGEHVARDDGVFKATFSTQTDTYVNPDINKFRQNYWWSFNNFSTPKLTYDQFATTFRDVEIEERHWLNPFNYLYYELLYKNVASGGNCFGMSLESVYAQVGRSIYNEPIFRFWNETQSGGSLNPSLSHHAKTINEINIKHGYQLGASAIDWVVLQYIKGRLDDPKYWFNETQNMFNRGDYPILCFASGLSSGHAVRPYKWDKSDPNLWKIYIADPNKPYGADNSNESSVVTINPNTNKFSFGNYKMIYAIPYSKLSTTPRTPFYEVLALISGATLFILGDNADTKQITDRNGKTFYNTSITDNNLFESLNKSSETKISDLARIPINASTGDALPEIYYSNGSNSYSFEIAPSAGVKDGTPIRWTLNNAKFKADVEIPAKSGVSDLVSVYNLNQKDTTFRIKISEKSATKRIKINLSGVDENKWTQIKDLEVSPGQELKFKLTDGGQKTNIENNGPRILGQLAVKPNIDIADLSLGTIQIDPGILNVIKTDAPETAIMINGENPKNINYADAVNVSFNVKDYSGKGIDYTEYSFNGTDWLRYNGAFSYSTKGESRIYFRSKDKDGNIESVRSQIIRIGNEQSLFNVKLTLRIGYDKLIVQKGSDEKEIKLDASPILLESRTFLPIRAVAENLGATVNWNDSEQRVDIVGLDKNIKLWIGKFRAKVNDVDKMIDSNNEKVVPFIVPPGRTMLPLRFIAESLGAEVEWQGDTQTVIITK